jgi:hypothetical protein
MFLLSGGLGWLLAINYWRFFTVRLAHFLCLYSRPQLLEKPKRHSGPLWLGSSSSNYSMAGSLGDGQK